MTLSQVTKFSTALIAAIILSVAAHPTWGQVESVLPRTVEWSPDGNMIAVGGETIGCNLDNPDPDNLRIFDADTLEVLFSIPDMGCKVVALEWSPDSKALAMSDIRGLRVWKVETQNFVFTTLMRPSVIRWSPDGDSLAIADLSGTTRTIDLETGELSPQFFITAFHVETIPLLDYFPASQPLSDISLSPDGNQISGAGPLPGLYIWATDTGELLSSIEEEGIYSTAWNPDGSKLAYVGDIPGGIVIVDVAESEH